MDGETPNIQGPITTADSAKSGRLIQDLQGMKKKKRKVVEKAVSTIAARARVNELHRPNRDMPDNKRGANFKAKEPLHI